MSLKIRHLLVISLLAGITHGHLRMELDESAKIYTKRSAEELVESNLPFTVQGSADERWFQLWWAQRQSGRSPRNPEKCHAYYSDFAAWLGSQTFTDLSKIVTHREPVVRYLDVSRNPYTKTSLAAQEGDSETLQGLRTCLRDRSQSNAIGCLFSSLSTCLPPVPKIIPGGDDAGNPYKVHAGREAGLCTDAICVSQLARAVPVEPRLANATFPDVSWLMLQLFAQLLQPTQELQRAVADEVAKFRGKTRGFTGPCVGIHVRRGDKLPECAEGKTSSCAFHMSLEDYFRPATAFLDQLHGGYMFVMTDDSSLLSHLDGARNKYPAVGLAGNTPGKVDVEGNDGLTDLIKLLASLEIGSTCQAVVGNSESEVTELLVLANCVRRGVCPPVHSMNGSPLQAFAGVIVDGRASSVDRAFDKFLPSS